MKAAIYSRLSKDSEGADISLERQERECREFAQRNDWEIVNVFREAAGTSAYKSSVERPIFDEACSALVRGDFDALLVWKLDRLSRRGAAQLGTLLDSLDSVKRGRLVSVTESLDSSNLSSRLTFIILSEMARSESANTSARVKAAKRDMRRRGLYQGGRLPFGMTLDETTKKLKPDEETALVAREIVNRALDGEPLRSISRWLNEIGVPSVRGGTWSHTSVSSMLTSPTLAAVASHAGSILRDETGSEQTLGEGIVTLSEHRLLAQRFGKKRGTGVPSSSRSRSLLADLLVSHEGYRMSADRATGVYRCRYHAGLGTKGVTVRIDAIERLVVGAVLLRIAALDPSDDDDLRLLTAAAKKLAAQEKPEIIVAHAQLESEIEALEARLALLDEDFYVRASLDEARYRPLAASLKSQIEAARANVEALPSTLDLTPLLDLRLVMNESDDLLGEHSLWEKLPLESRRSLLSLMLDRVVLSPAESTTTPLAQRVTLAWSS